MTIVIFGVSGAGKTTVGKMLADDLGWSFYDADDFHPPSNIEKMSACIPLTDADRYEWLFSLRRLVEISDKNGENIVLACSALKQTYRERLTSTADVKFVLLRVDAETVKKRFAARQGHFMPAELIVSQFGALEEAGPNVLVANGGLPPAEVVEIIKRLTAVPPE